LAPLVFVHHYERALVIGLGTGVTAHTVASFPFREIDIAEIAPGIVFAANRFFGHVNGNVLSDPRVKVQLTDGRNFVLLTPHQYDVITIELSNIWFAGASDLYSREFYQRCRARLSHGGVMQQWLQIHHIDTVDLLSVMKTLREVFPHVAFFLGGGQGILVASSEPLEVDYSLLAPLRDDPRFQQGISGSGLVGGDPLAVLSSLYLYGDNLTSTVALEPAARVNTDAFPFLAYSTPKGNQLSYALLANLKLLELRRYGKLPPIRRIPPHAVDYVLGLWAFGQGRWADAESSLQTALAKGNRDPRCLALLEATRSHLGSGAAP
jgi:spermidine synthase